MQVRKIEQIVEAMPVTEGAGVTVHRTIGTPALRQVDPFLMLDHFHSDNPDDYIAGFPDHPHRGFITFTYMLEGHMLHQDSMGNKGDLRAGAAQWMKAASGVIHSEMPQQTQGMMRGFQLWINLPASQKMTSPEYQEYLPETFPVVEENDQRIKVLAGDYNGTVAPIQDENTNVRYLDIELQAKKQFKLDLQSAENVFIYVYEGNIEIHGKIIKTHSLVLFSKGGFVELSATHVNARFILVSGLPLNEPVVQYGPFVMNTREEIEQAFSDYRDGTLVRETAQMHTD